MASQEFPPDAGIEGFAPVLQQTAGNPEALKYGKLWQHPEYRKVAPGEQLAQSFLQVAKPRPGAKVTDFGCGTGRGGLMLAVLGGLDVTLVDFVNNCLDDDVRAMLTTQAHVLRFIKADLERGPLPVSPYGFCTDVMEHVPADSVDRVLDNLLRAAQHVFFSISTVEDVCGALLDPPQKLHLTVQPYAWWLEQFTRRGCMIHWSQDAGGAALFYVSGWSTGTDVLDASDLNVAEAEILDNVRANLARNLSQVQPHSGRSPAEVMILGGGPSLNAFADEIKQRRADGAKLITLNGTYNWALERGLVPSAQIVVDARDFNARFVRPVIAGCRYLIASQCHPSVFEDLPADVTWIWHALSRGEGPLWEVLKGHYDPRNEIFYGVPGGPTVRHRRSHCAGRSGP